MKQLLLKLKIAFHNLKHKKEITHRDEKITLKLQQLGISKYLIHDDFSVSVFGDVSFRGYEHFIKDKLPIQFKNVMGSFSIEGCNLTSLEGCPQAVTGRFNCSHNQLTSLKYGPKRVGLDFDCSYNQLTNLDNSPCDFTADFYASNNKLTSLYGLQLQRAERGRKFDFSDNQLTHLRGFPFGFFQFYGCTLLAHHNKIEDMRSIKSSWTEIDLAFNQINKIELPSMFMWINLNNNNIDSICEEQILNVLDSDCCCGLSLKNNPIGIESNIIDRKNMGQLLNVYFERAHLELFVLTKKINQKEKIYKI